MALVEGRPTAAQLDRLRHGIRLRDGMAQPAEAEVIGPDDALFGAVAPEGARGDVSVVGIRIQEGRKHQVKRMFGAIGHKVLRLHRDEFGPLRLTGVAEGRWRLLTDGEVAAIGRVVGEAREAGARDGARGGERED